MPIPRPSIGCIRRLYVEMAGGEDVLKLVQNDAEVRVALENVVSVSSTLLLTEATMTDVPETREKARTPAEAEI
jgi:hypothetical protein